MIFVDILPREIHLHIAKYIVKSSLNHNALTLALVSPIQREFVLSFLLPGATQSHETIPKSIGTQCLDLIDAPTIPAQFELFWTSPVLYALLENALFSYPTDFYYLPFIDDILRYAYGIKHLHNPQPRRY